MSVQNHAPSTHEALRNILQPLDGSTSGTLAALNACGAFLQRNIGVIDIEPIRARFGDRWDRKSGLIWEQIHQFLRRQFRTEDLILQLDDTQVLIAQPGRRAAAAQMLCVRAALDLMRFFVGEAGGNQVSVKMVEGYEDGVVACSPVDPSVVRSLLHVQDAGQWRAKARRSTPILTPLGRELSADLWLEPILSLQPVPVPVGCLARAVLHDAASGALLDREARSQLQPRDVASADLKVLQETLRMRSEAPGLSGAMVVPVSYLTLAHSPTRYEFLEAIGQIPPAERRSLALEIVDLEPGVPSGRLDELVAIARRPCRGVMCRMEPTIPNAEKLKQAGATLSVLPDRARALTEQTVLKLEALIAESLKRVPAILLHQALPDALAAAGLVGITHCTVAESA